MTEMIPLIVFTVFGGIAAGAVLCSAFVDLRQPEGAQEVPFVKKPVFFIVVCLAALAVGLLGTLLHLGQPLRFLNGLSNPASMISQEGYWSIALGLVLVVAVAMGVKKGVPRFLTVLGGIVALGMMIVTSFAYYFAAGIPVWNGGATLPLFIVGDIAMGAALCALLIEDRQTLFLNVSACLAAVSLVVALAFQAQVVSAHVAFDFAPWTAVAMIVAGVLPIAAWAAQLKGFLAPRAASVAVLVLVVLGTAILRIGFFSVGMA